MKKNLTPKQNEIASNFQKEFGKLCDERGRRLRETLFPDFKAFLAENKITEITWYYEAYSVDDFGNFLDIEVFTDNKDYNSDYWKDIYLKKISFLENINQDLMYWAFNRVYNRFCFENGKYYWKIGQL